MTSLVINQLQRITKTTNLFSKKTQGLDNQEKMFGNLALCLSYDWL